MTNSPSQIRIYTVDITHHSQNARTIRLAVDIADYHNFKAELPTTIECTMDDFCEQVCETYKEGMEESYKTGLTTIEVRLLASISH